MRNIYLIFRRDFLGYVKAWGFWLSLAAVPLFLILGIGFGMFAATSSPVRYYAVVAPTPAISQAIEGEFQRRVTDAAEEAAELARRMNIPLSEAEDQIADAAGGGRKYFEVPAPARTLEELRPWLAGSAPCRDRQVSAACLPSSSCRKMAASSNTGAMT